MYTHLQCYIWLCLAQDGYLSHCVECLPSPPPPKKSALEEKWSNLIHSSLSAPPVQGALPEPLQGGRKMLPSDHLTAWRCLNFSPARKVCKVPACCGYIPCCRQICLFWRLVEASQGHVEPVLGRPPWECTPSLAVGWWNRRCLVNRGGQREGLDGCVSTSLCIFWWLTGLLLEGASEIDH